MSTVFIVLLLPRPRPLWGGVQPSCRGGTHARRSAAVAIVRAWKTTRRQFFVCSRLDGDEIGHGRGRDRRRERPQRRTPPLTRPIAVRACARRARVSRRGAARRRPATGASSDAYAEGEAPCAGPWRGAPAPPRGCGSDRGRRRSRV